MKPEKDLKSFISI